MLHRGDLFDVLPTLEPESFDACVTDPPYELGFMGKGWDRSGVANRPETWREVLRVLKPGAHLVAFGGTRTFHRMTCAIEDAGFEIRDCLSWLYGSGFPKSLDVSKAIDELAPRAGMFDGFAKHFGERRRLSGLSQKAIAEHFPSKTGGITGCVWNWENGANVPTLAQWAVLQPMLGLSDEWLPLIERLEAERDVVGRDKNWGQRGTVPVSAYGEFDITAPATALAKQWAGWGTALKPGWEPVILARKPFSGSVAANVARYGTGALNIDSTRLEAGAGGDRDDEPSAMRRYADSGGTNFAMQPGPRGGSDLGRWPPNVACDEDAARLIDQQSGELPGRIGMTQHGSGTNSVYGKFERSEQSFVQDGVVDTGGASRFFYCAKPSPAERDYGCAASGGGDRAARNIHPTVKPVELMRWLVKLVTPPGGKVLDPFTGSGTTGMACRYEFRGFVGIEREPEYAEIAERRMAAVAPLFGWAAAPPDPE